MLPVETIEAVFPSSAACGDIALLPMTLAHATAMEAMGVDISTAIDWDHVLIAAWILSTPSPSVRKTMCEGTGLASFKRWLSEEGPSPHEVIDGVERIVAAAFNAFVAPAKDGPDANAKLIWGGETNRGFGWTLEIAEAVAHEYGIPLDDALDIPMCRVYAMMNCARARNGGKFGGPDYYERTMQGGIMEQFRKMKQGKASGE